MIDFLILSKHLKVKKNVCGSINIINEYLAQKIKTYSLLGENFEDPA